MPSQFLTPVSVDNHNRSVGKCERGAVLSLSRTAALIFVFVGVACGGAPAPSSNLPRTTNQNISITMIESVETLAMAGCHTYWLTSNQEPPPGACEQTATVRRFIAQHDGEHGGDPAKGPTTVETSVVGEFNFDPLYAMQLASRNLTEGVSVVVVMPPPDTTLVRLVDSTGAVVDRVTASSGLVALAGLGSDLTVQAISGDGKLIAECPPNGVTLDEVTYVCTIASGATIPITTTTLADVQTP